MLAGLPPFFLFQNTASQPVARAMDDHRVGHDNNVCTFDEFLEKYGHAGYALWPTACRADAGAPQSGVAAECRLAYDDHSYTWKEFVDVYGPKDGSTFW